MINIKKFFTFIIMVICSSCSRTISFKLPIEDPMYSYIINYNSNWDFYDYGTDGENYNDPYLKTIATFSRGNKLDTKIMILLPEKKDEINSCILGGEKSNDYDEEVKDNSSKIYYKNNKLVVDKSIIEKWLSNNDAKKNKPLRVYFSASSTQCILFMISEYNAKNKREVAGTFYKIITSLHQIKKINSK